MPYAGSFISRDNALYALDIGDRPRSFDEFNFSELTDWSSTNSSVSIVLDNREYPLFYVFKIVPNNANEVTFTLSNVTIGGMNVTNLNNMDLVGHALVKCTNSITVNTTLGVRSTIDTSRSDSSSQLTSINPGIQTAVRSDSIIVNRNKSAVITGAYGNGSYITYYSKNSYSPGDSVYIFDTGLSSFNYDSTPAIVQYATPQLFTVSNNAVSYVQPTSSYSYISGPTTHQISTPFPEYSGENLIASLGFSFSGHEGDEIYVTIPIITDMNRIFSSWATQITLDTTPQVYREIDEVSSPTWPMARLIHSLTAGVEDVMDKYAYMARTDPTVQSGFVDVDDNVNKSYLVDPDIAFPKHYDWLLQFIGQTRSYSTISSNKSADYRATIKVRCATTANITISTALNTPGTDQIDGITLAAGDRVLVKNQTVETENGIYIVGATPARWSGMPASSVNISLVTPVTPSLGYAQFTTGAAHGFSVGDTIVIAGVTPSGYNGEYAVYSVPSTTTFVVETTQVATATISSTTVNAGSFVVGTTYTILSAGTTSFTAIGAANNTAGTTFVATGVGSGTGTATTITTTAKRSIDTTTPDLIFVREGTVNKMTMWSPQSQGWTGTAHGSTSITNDRTIATRTNLITNPSFEINATGWSSESTSISSNLASFVGSSSLQTTMVSTTDSNIANTTINIPASGSLAMSLYVYVPPASPLAGRTVTLARESGTAVVSSPSSIAATLVGGSWVRCSVTYTVTAAGNAAMVARLSGDLTTASGQVVYLDAALAENTATVSDYFDGSTRPNSIWTGTAHGSTSQLIGRANLCPNPSFETNTTSWETYNADAVKTAGTIAGGSGSWSLVGTANSTAIGGVFFGAFTPVIGAPISVSAQCLRGPGSRVYRESLGPNDSKGITAVSGNGTTVTYTTSTAHGFTAGQLVTVAGVMTTTAYNGSFTIASAPSTTTFTVTAATTGTGTISTGLRSYYMGIEFNNNKSITAVSGNGTTVTYTTSTAHNFLAGNSVVISGITTTTAYNGTKVIASVPTATTFTVTASTTGTGTISGDETAVRSLTGFNGTAQTCATSTRLSATGTVPTTANQGSVTIYSSGTGTIGDSMQIDSVLVEYSSSVRDYFDGYNDENSSWAIVGNEFINFSVKQVAAKVATTSNIVISNALNTPGTDQIDGITLAAGDYVLVKNQTTASENGVYQVASTPVRITDLPVGIPLSAGFRTYVWGSGTQNAETMFTLDDDGVVGADSLAFTATVKPFAWDDSDDFKLWQLTNKYFGYKAGTIESIEETVKRYLIGNKGVQIILNPPFEFTIYTLRNETPGIYYTSSAINTSEVITNAVSIIKPMGFNVMHVALEEFDTFIIGDPVEGIIGEGRLG